MKYKVKSIVKTCEACPTQWEGKLYDGRMIYIRYRHGYLGISISDSKTNNVMDAVKGETIFGLHYGNDLDGCMSFDTLVHLTNGVLDYSNRNDESKLFSFINDYESYREDGLTHEETIRKLEEDGYYDD